MISTTTKPDLRSLQPRWPLIFSTTGLIDSRPRCALGRVSSSSIYRGELDTVLARPRYSRSQIAGNEGKAGIAATATEPDAVADWDLRADRDRGAACPAGAPGGQDDGVEEPGVAGLSAPHAGRRRAYRQHLSGWHQTRAGCAVRLAPCLAVRWARTR